MSSIGIDRGSIGLTYDGSRGLLQSMTTPEGEGIEWAYDEGTLLTESIWTGTVTADMTFGYDSNLRLANQSIDCPTLSSLACNAVTYQYDDDDLLRRAGPHAVDARRPRTAAAGDVRPARCSTPGRTTDMERRPTTPQSCPAKISTPSTTTRLGRTGDRANGDARGDDDGRGLPLRHDRPAGPGDSRRNRHGDLQLRREREPADEGGRRGDALGDIRRPGSDADLRRRGVQLHRERRAADEDRPRRNDDLRLRRAGQPAAGDETERRRDRLRDRRRQPEDREEGERHER